MSAGIASGPRLSSFEIASSTVIPSLVRASDNRSAAASFWTEFKLIANCSTDRGFVNNRSNSLPAPLLIPIAVIGARI